MAKRMEAWKEKKIPLKLFLSYVQPTYHKFIFRLFPRIFLVFHV